MIINLFTFLIAICIIIAESTESYDSENPPDDLVVDFVIQDFSLPVWMKELTEWPVKLFESVKSVVSHVKSLLENDVKKAVTLVSSIGSRVKAHLESLAEKIQEVENISVKKSLKKLEKKLKNFSSKVSSELQSAVESTENTILHFGEHVETKISEASSEIKANLDNAIHKLERTTTECHTKYNPDVENLKSDSIKRAERCALEAKDSVVGIFNNRIKNLILEVPRSVEEAVITGKNCLRELDTSEKVGCVTGVAVKAGLDAGDILLKVSTFRVDIVGDVDEAIVRLTVCVAEGLLSTGYEVGKVTVELAACIL